MPLSVNTSDSLSSALTYLLAVDDDNAVKFLKGGLTPVVGSGVSVQTGALGRAFRTGTARDVNSLITWARTTISSTQPITVFVAYNQYNGGELLNAGTCAGMFAGRQDGDVTNLSVGAQVDLTSGKVMPTWDTLARAQSVITTNGTASSISAAGAHSIAWRTNSAAAASVSVLVDGARDSNYSTNKDWVGETFGYPNSAATFNGIGGDNVGSTFYSTLSLDYVYVAIFIGTTVSDADILRLHNSLSGSNAFALVAGAVGASAEITATTADAIFSGASVGYVASSSAQVAATTADAAFSGSAFVAAASGSFVTDPMVNNTGTLQASVAVLYEWRVGAGIGVAPASVNYGTGTTDASGVLTATGLTAGTGALLVATTDRASIYYQAGTVA